MFWASPAAADLHILSREKSGKNLYSLISPSFIVPFQILRWLRCKNSVPNQKKKIYGTAQIIFPRWKAISRNMSGHKKETWIILPLFNIFGLKTFKIHERLVWDRPTLLHTTIILFLTFFNWFFVLFIFNLFFSSLLSFILHTLVSVVHTYTHIAHPPKQNTSTPHTKYIIRYYDFKRLVGV